MLAASMAQCAARAARCSTASRCCGRFWRSCLLQTAATRN